MKPRRAIRWIICLLAVEFLAGSSTPARADVAPMEPPYGANPQPGSETTKVRMMAETVLIDVHDDTMAYVTASFTMRNLGEVEEQMEVGFPLDQGIAWGNLCDSFYPFDPITDLKAWVDGYQTNTTKIYEAIRYGVTGPYTVTVPCWEEFQVIFPPEKDVNIQITYTGEPYYHDKAGSYIYSYVLSTGAGWKGTIGSADITVRMPYEINKYNYNGCSPKPCTLTDREVKWHFEDFEPENRAWDIMASFDPPYIWERITVERINTAKNPNDGEAWGRLGKAYKEALGGFRGYAVYDEAGREMFQWSMDAYQKALTILPDDPDWHFGYAELICTEIQWNDEIIIRPEEVNWVTCLEQLRLTLALNPAHEKALSLLEGLSIYYRWADTGDQALVDLSGEQPVFLGLTQTPLPRPTATQLLTPTITDIQLQTATITDSPRPMITGMSLSTAAPTWTATRRPTATIRPTWTFCPSELSPETSYPASGTTLLAAERSVPATLTPQAADPTAGQAHIRPAGAAVPAEKESPRLPVGLAVGVGAVVVLVIGMWVVMRARR